MRKSSILQQFFEKLEQIKQETAKNCEKNKNNKNNKNTEINNNIQNEQYLEMQIQGKKLLEDFFSLGKLCNQIVVMERKDYVQYLGKIWEKEQKNKGQKKKLQQKVEKYVWWQEKLMHINILFVVIRFLASFESRIESELEKSQIYIQFQKYLVNLSYQQILMRQQWEKNNDLKFSNKEKQNKSCQNLGGFEISPLKIEKNEGHKIGGNLNVIRELKLYGGTLPTIFSEEEILVQNTEKQLCTSKNLCLSNLEDCFKKQNNDEFDNSDNDQKYNSIKDDEIDNRIYQIYNKNSESTGKNNKNKNTNILNLSQNGSCSSYIDIKELKQDQFGRTLIPQ
ncbi:hypothetical protein PPERSA_02769 [Pseudocohnilembus persalinus]|uniref:Uncharacterized protein n=1 Tax=Pseudocohnilembus persalinus TaxID=266149 RepID=A0A0V0Q8R2_PSEPJ|nr:hypothetical protein PPERSA_02769 [Pseudocohnilembus persalinus]|eukprot:KRW98621.1 hypothetical protein PPERSA_02769 [Pseudocohnilembus persalinus]